MYSILQNAQTVVLTSLKREEHGLYSFSKIHAPAVVITIRKRRSMVSNSTNSDRAPADV